MDWEQERRGVLSIFLRGWAAAATVGSLLGKISAALWSAAEPAITINERKRPVRAHKGEKDNRRQRIRDGEKERGKEGKRETTYEEVRVRQRDKLKALQLEMEETVQARAKEITLIRELDKPP